MSTVDDQGSREATLTPSVGTVSTTPGGPDLLQPETANSFRSA